MFRNSSAKSSISDAKSFTRVREVVVEVDGRNGGEQPGRRRDQRFGDARRDDGETRSSPAAPMFWKAIMMPHTVPNSPMNGVMLAVVARNGTRFSSLFTSTVDARSSARSTRRGSSGWTRRQRLPGLCASRLRLPQLRVQLGVAGLKHADQRAVRERRTDGLHLGELAALAEHVEERRGLALERAERQNL